VTGRSFGSKNIPMNDSQHPDESKPEPASEVVAAKSTLETASPAAGEPAKKLTPEEQMALYEEHLKETDWGHQPC
jgi:hypothetical protein